MAQISTMQSQSQRQLLRGEPPRGEAAARTVEASRRLPSSQALKVRSVTVRAAAREVVRWASRPPRVVTGVAL